MTVKKTVSVLLAAMIVSALLCSCGGKGPRYISCLEYDDLAITALVSSASDVYEGVVTDSFFDIIDKYTGRTLSEKKPGPNADLWLYTVLEVTVTKRYRGAEADKMYVAVEGVGRNDDADFYANIFREAGVYDKEPSYYLTSAMDEYEIGSRYIFATADKGVKYERSLNILQFAYDPDGGAARRIRGFFEDNVALEIELSNGCFSAKGFADIDELAAYAKKAREGTDEPDYYHSRHMTFDLEEFGGGIPYPANIPDAYRPLMILMDDETVYYCFVSSSIKKDDSVYPDKERDLIISVSRKKFEDPLSFVEEAFSVEREEGGYVFLTDENMTYSQYKGSLVIVSVPTGVTFDRGELEKMCEMSEFEIN